MSFDLLWLCNIISIKEGKYNIWLVNKKDIMKNSQATKNFVFENLSAKVMKTIKGGDKSPIKLIINSKKLVIK